MKKRIEQTSLAVRVIAVFCASVIVVLMTDLLVPRNEGAIYSSVIRLHILANSDREEDQIIKLLVRDEIVLRSEQLFPDGDEMPLEEMEEIGKKLAALADEVLEENGVCYRADAVWGTEIYPAREYDGIVFPSGEYYSLRIVLGDAEGQNWWCVLFPPLCLNSATAKESLGEVGIDTNSSKVYTEKKYVFRFKIVEWFGELFGAGK